MSPPQRLGLAALYRASPLGVVGAVGSGVAQGALFGMGAVYAERLGLSTSGIATFMAAPLVGGMLAQFPIGRFSDRLDRRKVLLAIVVLAATVCTFGLRAEVMPAEVLLGLMALLGAAILPLYALCIAHTNDALTAEQMVNASGTLVLASGIGLSAGPLAVSLSMEVVGPAGFFGFLLGVHVLRAAFAGYRVVRRPARPVAEQGHYVAVNRASPVFTEVALEAARE